MLIGAHAIIYSANPDADRAFLRDVIKLTSVDVGHGWLIFGLPPSEVAVHPAETSGAQELYLMCDDVEARGRHGDARHCLRAGAESGMGPADATDAARRRETRRLPAAPCPARADGAGVTNAAH